jgi:serine/threonine kinase PknH
MTVFISHSSRDHAAVRSLLHHLQTAHESVWLDQSLIGGDAWWRRIIHQIESCTVFMIALSNSCLQSKPCRAEIEYAKALGLPILPVLIGDVDSYRIDPIFTVQSIDFRNPDAAAGAALIAAVRERAAERKPLPDPKPEPPPVPYEYLQRLGVAIGSPEELSPIEQSTILADLRQALRTEDDDSVREDIHRLLSALRRRSEVMLATVEEIDDLKRRYPADGKDAPAPPRPPEPAPGGVGENPAAQQYSPFAPAGQPIPFPAAGAPTGPRSPVGGPSGPRSPGSRRTIAIAIAVAATVVVAVIAVVAYLLVGRPSQGSATNKPAKSSASTSAPIAPAAMDGLLLGATEINTAMGATGMTMKSGGDGLGTQTRGIHDKNCEAVRDPVMPDNYTDTGWLSARGKQFQNGDANNVESNPHLVWENVVLFPTAKEADAFYTASAQSWESCSNRRITYTTPPASGAPGPSGTPAEPSTYVWSVGPISNDNGTLSTNLTEEGGRGWSCQRALTVRNNVAIDVIAYGLNPGDGAVNIAHQIAAKVANDS